MWEIFPADLPQFSISIYLVGLFLRDEPCSFRLKKLNLFNKAQARDMEIV